MSGLYTIHETKRETWTWSLEHVTHMTFGDWCAKIEKHLQVGQSLEVEAT
jgi:hypothetical protein